MIENDYLTSKNCNITRIVGVLFEIFKVNRDLSARDEDLKFVMVEHSKPLDVDNLRQTFSKSGTLQADLEKRINFFGLYNEAKLDDVLKSGCLQILRNGFPGDFQDIKEKF